MHFVLDQDQKEIIREIIDVLNMGRCVLFPTNEPLCWCIWCDATNLTAVESLIAMKQSFKPQDWVLFVLDEIMLAEYIGEYPSRVKKYLHHQNNKQTAVLYKYDDILHPKVVQKLEDATWNITVQILPSIDTLGMQMSRHVLRLFGKPIFVTPAVLSDGLDPSPIKYEDIEPAIQHRVWYVSPIRFDGNIVESASWLIAYDDEWWVQVIR